MTSSPKDGMYFDGDIGMSADALIEMFGEEAPLRAQERAADKELDGDEDGRRFWQAVAEEITKRLSAK